MLESGTADPRGILKTCKRDGQGIKYGVTVNLGAYQAMAVAMNILSLADKLTELDRQHRMRRFRESYQAPGERPGVSARQAMPAGTSADGYSGRMRLHQNTGAAAGDEDRNTPRTVGRSTAPVGGPASASVNQTSAASVPGRPAVQSSSSAAPEVKATQVSRQPAVYGPRESDFTPHPARRVAP
jgi:hypothetical protein